MRSLETTPCGRNELLGWINTLCGAEYPALEALRDGAGYCTVIEAATNRVKRNCAAAGFADLNGASARATTAKMLLNKVDWSATSHVYEVVDPAQDSTHDHYICFKNICLLQRMLRECVFPEYSTEIEPDRLASGKLQDHLHFLSWLYNYIKKVLTAFSKTEILRKAGDRTSTVEGVKRNRAMILLREKRLGFSQKDSGVGEPSPSPFISSKTRSGNTPEAIRSAPRGGERALDSSKSDKNRISASTNIPYSPREDRLVEEKKSRSPASSSFCSGSAEELPQEKEYLPNRNSPSCGDEGKGLHCGPSITRTQRGVSERLERNVDCVMLPSTFKDSFIEIRRLVEDLEHAVLLDHNEYQSCIAPPSHGREDEILTDAHDGDHNAHRIPSLFSLGKLLEERDALKKIYAEIEEVYQSTLKRGISTPLLMHVGSVLYPPRKL